MRSRLIASMDRAGIGPNQNVYAEIGSTWWYVMRYPDQAAHVVGKLLKHVGQDNVLWGTDCLFYGSPQPLIQAMRTFQISQEFRERYGYPKLTKELKAKILGLNGAALYEVEPNTSTCEFTRRELEQIEWTEELGFDEVWFAEDCFLKGGIGQAAVALATTSRIVIGMGILPAGARNVAFAALEIAFLANLYPGRLMVGIGHGMAEWMRQVGAHPTSPLTLLQEYLQALRALLAGETVTFSGRHVQLSSVRLDEPPAIVPEG